MNQISWLTNTIITIIKKITVKSARFLNVQQLYNLWLVKSSFYFHVYLNKIKHKQILIKTQSIRKLSKDNLSPSIIFFFIK